MHLGSILAGRTATLSPAQCHPIHIAWWTNILLLPGIPKTLPSAPMIPLWVTRMWLESQGLAFVFSAFTAELVTALSYFT